MKSLPETNADRCAEQHSLILLGGISCTVRLIYSAAVYLQNTGNAGWLEVIGGVLATIPSVFFLQRLMREKDFLPEKAGGLQTLVSILFVFSFSFDGSSWVFALAESTSHTTFAEKSLYFLYIPALLTASLIASRGGNACGGLARGALPLILFMLFLAAMWQVRQLHPVWLTPVLGSGLAPIARGSALCAGYASLYPAGVWIFLQKEKQSEDDRLRSGMPRMLAAAGFCAMLFLLYYGMLTPNIPNAPHLRSFAMERLLTGGGRTTSVHFPSLISWYAMLIITAVHSIFCTAAALGSLMPKGSHLFCSCIAAVLCLLWTPVRMFWKQGEDLLVFANVIIVTLSMFALYLQTWIRKRRRVHAQD